MKEFLKSTDTYNFVKETKRDLYFIQRQKEADAIIDKETQKIKSEIAVDVSTCPVCAHPIRESKHLFSKMSIEFYLCKDCGHIYANPQLSEQYLERHYRYSKSYKLWVEVLLSNKNRTYDAWKHNEALDLVESQGVEPGELLEIGSFVGSFLLLARERGWNTTGMEFNEEARKLSIEEHGLTVYPDRLEDIDFKGKKFDLIAMWAVIEHLPQPSSFINIVSKLLNSGGKLLLFNPNGDSLVFRVLREQSATVDGVVHPSIFTNSSLSRVLSDNGLSIIKQKYYQPEIQTILNYLDLNDAYIKGDDMRFFGNLLSDEIKTNLEKWVLDNGLGYKVMTLAEKIDA
jgi:2-polyprenyl-3-methyl-5-hydroxy-6-metoxy-1,4-benzoquinol methylase